MLTIISLAALGILVGLISSFFGVGGGVVIIPSLTFFFPEYPPTVIVACSLATICVNGIINTFHFYRSGQKPEFSVVALLGLAMVAGSLIGSRLSIGVDPDILKKSFAALLFIVTIKTILPKKAKQQQDFKGIKLSPLLIAYLAFFGLLGGLLAGFMGVGGGIIVVPMLTTLFYVPFNRVSAYSNPVMAMGTFAACVSYMLTPLNTFAPLPFANYQVGHINFMAVSVIVVAILIIAPYGVRLTKVVSPKKSKWAFAALLLFMAIKMTKS